jgi:hypothetical protein
VGELDAHGETLDAMLRETRAMQVSLQALTGQYQSVEGSARALQSTCESLLEQQVPSM